MSDVEVVQAAAWTTDGMVEFMTKGSVTSRIVQRDKERSQAVGIRAVALSRYLEGRDVDLLKIDIEGAEMEVLRSCVGRLGRVKRLFVEYHGASDHAQALPDLLEILRREGFRMYVKEATVHRVHPFRPDRPSLYDLQLNVYAWRELSAAAPRDTLAIFPEVAAARRA